MGFYKYFVSYKQFRHKSTWYHLVWRLSLRNSDQHPLIAKRKNKIKSNLVSINDTLTKFGLYRRTSKNDSYEQKKNLIIIIINFQIYEK